MKLFSCYILNKIKKQIVKFFIKLYLERRIKIVYLYFIELVFSESKFYVQI